MTPKDGPIHPNEVLEALLLQTTNAERATNLKNLHKLCEAQALSGKDFSRKTMRRFCDKAGIFNGRILYNTDASAPLLELLSAWNAYAGAAAPPRKEARPAAPTNDSLLRRIEDPALRALLHSKLAELERLRGELRMLKATPITIDLRPRAPQNGPTGESEPLMLTASERAAVELAASPSFLRSEGWKEGSRGEVVTDRGTTLYQVGYLRALRKLLSACPSQLPAP